jgi:hypothetical protein
MRRCAEMRSLDGVDVTKKERDHFNSNSNLNSKSEHHRMLALIQSGHQEGMF